MTKRNKKTEIIEMENKIRKNKIRRRIFDNI